MNSELVQRFSAFPSKILADENLPADGVMVAVNGFCRRKFGEGPTCSAFYKELITQTDGYHRCPFGFTAYRTNISGVAIAVTSIVPLPRDQQNRNEKEDQRLRDHKTSGVDRSAIERAAASFAGLEAINDGLEKAAMRKLPHALHEIRKLNAAIKAESEDLYKRTSNNSALTVFNASEFMSTQFDLLDLLINESITQLPTKQLSGLDKLVHKCIKIFESRAEQKHVRIDFNKRESVFVKCCDKTLPIVITILLDNAIRYSPEHSTVKIQVKRGGTQAVFCIDNAGVMKLPPERLFKKHQRGDTDVEGSGFGLYFAEKIATQHSGTITCDSRDGRVVFRFALPTKS